MSWLLLIWSFIQPFVLGVFKSEMQLVLPVVEKYVLELNSTDISNEDKRNEVFRRAVNELKSLYSGHRISDLLVNLCIELAVAKMKAAST